MAFRFGRFEAAYATRWWLKANTADSLVAILRGAYYPGQVIKSFANSATRQFAETGKSKFSGLDEQRARRRLADLNGIVSLDELSPLKSVGLHKLGGDRKGHWAIIINGPWRLVFRFHDGDAYDVEIVDYH